jgi:hypothetical protein
MGDKKVKEKSSIEGELEHLIEEQDEEQMESLKDMVSGILGINVDEIGKRLGNVEKKIDIIVDHQKKLTDAVIKYIQTSNEVIKKINYETEKKLKE